ncbi:MAG: hypothetical protein HQ581_13320, partial [Planctomycetes bacterium]|nr:hypothetical protein [Planctomycetota bacterium]
MRRLLRSSHGIVLALAVTGVGMMSAGGCARNLGKAIASAPNRLNLLASDANPLPPAVCLAGVDCQFPVRVGPPEATLSVAVLDPPLEIGPPRGTILVSHGFYGQSLAMMGTARRLAEAGYRAVL